MQSYFQGIRSSILTLSLLAISGLALASEADLRPLSVQNYRVDDSLKSEDFVESQEPTTADIEDYLTSKKNNSTLLLIERLSSKTVGKQGTIHIVVHKSNKIEVPEYIEVFKQNSDDPNDLIEQYLFDNATSNQALTSTAGTYGKKVYSTPSGIYNIDSMEKMHYSSKYNNAPMPWTMFFNGGIAIHGATPSEFKLLGRKASHGCVRLHPDNAQILYEFVKAEGGTNRKNVLIKVADQ